MAGHADCGGHIACRWLPGGTHRALARSDISGTGADGTVPRSLFVRGQRFGCAAGVDTKVERGPGRALARMVRSVSRLALRARPCDFARTWTVSGLRFHAGHDRPELLAQPLGTAA